ncbi:3-oxoacyl-(acyl carrier protein) synthase III [Porphyromonas gingivalis]|nr:3-oxoacyl-(acyl carrier protein) synthase III [Porphyromonas gingivalis]
MNEVFITRTSSFLPNEAVENDNMEQILGMVGGHPSRVRSIILRQNGIKKRYYSLDREGKIVYTNAELTAIAVNKLFDQAISFKDIGLLACGTSLPDQLFPSHAVMTHGLLGNKPIDLLSPSGVCLRVCMLSNMLIYPCFPACLRMPYRQARNWSRLYFVPIILKKNIKC